MKIVAMVRFNNDWAYVFDEAPSLKYREEMHGGGRFLVGQDGPFFDFLQYEKPKGRSKAFAGRTLRLPMEDGTVWKVKDSWWQTTSPIGGMAKITHSTVAELKRCYVFYGAYCDAKLLQKAIAEYENRTSGPYGHRAGGYRYDYYDFEKIIKFDDLMTSKLRESIYFEKTKGHLVKKVKDFARKVAA